MATACYVASDLTTLRLAGDDGGLTWRAEPVGAGDEGEPAPPPVRERAAAAAAFLRRAIRERQQSLGPVCVSVDDAMCSWIAAPSADAGVITAAVRRRGAEWDRDTAGESVQPLAERRGRRGLLDRARQRSGDQNEPESGAHLAVLEALDGPLRLWLDELDRRAERPATVQTLWHALTTVWADTPAPAEGDEAELVGVVFRERDDRVVWAWGAAGSLIAGGGLADAPLRPREGDDDADAAREHIDDLAGRLSLDWLTWTAQIGRAPSRIVVVAPDAPAMARAIERRWEGAAIEPETEADPVGALLIRLGDAVRPPAQDDPRRSLLSATRRPARAHRRLIRVASLALLILAFGVGALGWRARQTAGAFRAEADRAEARFRQVVADAAPELANNPMAGQQSAPLLRSALAQLREANPPISEPDPPLPIKRELQRFLVIVAGVDGAELESVAVGERNASATVFTDEVIVGEELVNALRDSEGALEWRGNFSPRGARFSWQLSALWEDDR